MHHGGTVPPLKMHRGGTMFFERKKLFQYLMSKRGICFSIIRSGTDLQKEKLCRVSGFSSKKCLNLLLPEIANKMRHEKNIQACLFT